MMSYKPLITVLNSSDPIITFTKVPKADIGLMHLVPRGRRQCSKNMRQDAKAGVKTFENSRHDNDTVGHLFCMGKDSLLTPTPI